MKKLPFIVAGVFVVAGCISSQAQQLPLDPAVRTGTLPNGLTYFIRHNEEPKNRALFYLVNNVGSILEDDDQQGLAHFMEHMSFNGTAHYPKNALIDYLQKNGVRFGADINAYTNFDETVYQLPLPTDKPEVLANGLQIIRDWANSALLDPGEIDKERGVVLEEKRLGKGAGERMRRLYWPMITNDSRYAVRQAIGTDSVLNGFVPATLRRFYQDWYRPDLQAVIIVGDIDADRMEKEIKTRFADLKNPAQERPRVKYSVPLRNSGRVIVATDPELTSTQAEVLIKHPGLVIKTDADYRRDLVRNLLNEMLQRRYGELTRTANPPFVQAGAGVGGFVGGLDVFSGSLTARPGQLEPGFKAMWREIIRAKRFGFTATELDRAKAGVLSATTAALKEKGKTASAKYVGEYQEYFLKGEAAPGIDIEYALTVKDLPGISLTEVNAMTGELLAGADRDVLVLAPEKDKASLPDSSAVAGWISAVDAEPLEAYTDEVNTLPLLAHPPVAGKTVDEKRDEKLGVTTLTLGNGLKVVLKPTDFKNDQILFNGFASGGTSIYPDADYESAASAAAVVAAGGVGNYDESGLEKFLAGKQLSVSPGIDERTQRISGSSTPADLESALQLVYAYFTEPRKDSAVFASVMERTRAQLVNRANNPNAVFGDSVNAILGNYSIRRTGPSLEKLARIDLDKAYRIYKERFADASGFTFVFTGSFTVASIRPMLERYLGGLPSTHSDGKAKDLGIHIPSGTKEKIVYKGSEPKATVYMILSGTFDHSAQQRVEFEALKEVLQIRMLERLREDESGVYSPGVSFNAVKYPEGRYTMVVSFGCAPANADKLVASALDEIAKVRRDGPLPSNVDKWRAEAKASRETAVKTNGFWMGYLVSQLQNDEDLHALEGYSGLVDKVTAASLRDAAKRYLSGVDYIRLELMPEK